MPKKRKRSGAAANSPTPAYIDDDANGQLSLLSQVQFSKTHSLQFNVPVTEAWDRIDLKLTE